MRIRKYAFDDQGSVAVIKHMGRKDAHSTGFIVDKEGVITHFLGKTTPSQMKGLEIALNYGTDTTTPKPEIRDHDEMQRIDWLGSTWSLTPVNKTVEELEANTNVLGAAGEELTKVLKQHAQNPEAPSGWRNKIVKVEFPQPASESSSASVAR